MDDEGNVSWEKVVTIIFIIVGIIVLLVLLTMALLLPVLNN